MKFKKAMIGLGGIADSVLVVFLSYKLFTNFFNGNDTMGIAFTIALGIWCISCTLGSIRKSIEDNKPND